jgi:hypothetical protein
MTRPGSRARKRSISAATRAPRGPGDAVSAQSLRRIAQPDGGAGAGPFRGCCHPPTLAIGDCPVHGRAGDVGVPGRLFPRAVASAERLHLLEASASRR